MASVNKVILVGNLGKDPEVKMTNNGKKVANFSLATTEKYNGGESKTEWHNITLWEKTAEVAEKYLKKGDQVYLEGKIQTRQYEDKDGVKRSVTDIIGTTLTMLGTKKSGESSEGAAQKAEASASDYMQKNTPSTPASGAVSEPQTANNWAASDDDDLPF